MICTGESGFVGEPCLMHSTITFTVKPVVICRSTIWLPVSHVGTDADTVGRRKVLADGEPVGVVVETSAAAATASADARAAEAAVVSASRAT